MQMVNKSGPGLQDRSSFTEADEVAFRTFSVYCGLALHHAKLYDKIRRSEQKLKVSLEVLSYHSMATAAEVASVEASFNSEVTPEAQELAKYDQRLFECFLMCSTLLS